MVRSRRPGEDGAFDRSAARQIVGMKWDDLVDGAWIIETEDREKGNADELVLPDLARAVVEAQPRFARSPYVFAGRGADQMSGFSKMKARLDRLSGVADWTLRIRAAPRARARRGSRSRPRR